jgi:hypothetical protein
LTPAASAAPRDEVLRLVPEDVGFCLIVQDLRGHAAAFLASPFYRRFHASPLYQVLRNTPEVKKLLALEKFLQDPLGIDWPRLRDDILGDAVAFAYRPGPSGKPEEEQGLLLLKARDGKLLAEVFARLNKVQEKSGDLKQLEVLEHNGVKYYRRVEKNGEHYVYLRDALLALSSQQAFVQQAIDLDRKAGTEEGPVAKQLRQLGADKAFVSLWVNPRVFQGEIERLAKDAPGAEASFLQTFAGYWKALEGAALYLSLDKELELALALRADPERLPPAARKLFAEFARRSELWARFPDDALLAAAGRIDAAALVEVLSDFLPKEERQVLLNALGRNLGAALGKDFCKDVLPNLGPDVGLCVTAPPADDKAWFPHTVLALRVRPGSKETPVDQALVRAVDFYALSLVFGYNRRHEPPDQLALKSVFQDKVEVKYLVNDRLFPPGLQPGYALQAGYLVLGSSPEAIRRFGTAPAAPVTPAKDDVPLLRLSLKDLRRFVKERREPLADFVAAKNQLSREEVGKALDKLLIGLDLLDRLELTQRSTGAGQLTLTLRIHTVEPLK